VLSGFKPSFAGTDSVLLAVGILGATVMPHVIYLHSSLVARRPDGRDRESIIRRMKATKIDVIIALSLAGIVNLAMLWVAATLLHDTPGGAPDTLEAAQTAYGNIAGQGTATAFALALLASGFASASVGTFSGQIVMEEFTSRRIPILVRRLITLLPALVVLAVGIEPTAALVGSQVVLSFGIPFALVPLVRFTASREVMGEWVVGRGTTVAACGVAAMIIALNALLIVVAAAG